MINLSEVRWGIIGAGDVCEVKSGPAFQNIYNSKLVAIMRRDADKAEDFAKRHGVPFWYSDASELINNPEINAIYIATPPNTHEYYTKLAAEAGKVVYVEKPMALNHQECQRMIAICNKNNVPLFVAFYRRSLPNFIKIKELLDQEVIGQVRNVQIKMIKTLLPNIVGAAGQRNNWRANPQISGGGYFYDLACHQLDILDFLFGPIKSASGYAANQSGIYEGEDMTVGSFHFENGALGTGIWCFNSSESAETEITTIVGSKGKITFSYFGDHSVNVKIDGEETQVYRFDISKHIQQPHIQTIVEELTGNGQCTSTGISGARTAWVMDQICQRIDVNDQ